jgi:pyruvate formate-lyase activating enzyme-like uncharacterized protein
MCTRNCFYCPQDRATKKESLPQTDQHLQFDSAKEYVNYLKTFHFEGIGISGGEPFLAFDRVIEYIKLIRDCLGSRHYIWIYTNGDLVTDDKLKKLKDAGLNEIRFDISAADYNLKPASMAAKYFHNIAVEIPAIPEDLDILKSNLKKIEDIGVKYLNLHQLMMNSNNRAAFIKRNYTVTNTRLYKNDSPVIESELAAFDILKHALRINSSIGVNYCSRCYKARFQGKAYRKRYASLCREESESVTRTGYLVRSSISGTQEQLKQIMDQFHHREKVKCRISKNSDGAILVFPLQCLEKVLADDSYGKIDITYLSPQIEPTVSNDENEKYSAKKNIAFQFELTNRSSAMFFQKLFVENKSIGQAAKESSAQYGIEPDQIHRIIDDMTHFHDQFVDIEYIAKDMPDYT